MKQHLYFQFYDVSVGINISDVCFQPIIDLLVNDFIFFYTPGRQPESWAQIQIEVGPSSMGTGPSEVGVPIFKTRMCSVYGLGKKRICKYRRGSTVTSCRNKNQRTFHISGSLEHIEELYEVAYLALLSAVGEELDLLGYHRIHALGIQYLQTSSLLLLPSGGGKSSMASLLLKRDGFSLFSDEMPLLRNGMIYPFPIRIALRPNISEALFLDLKQCRMFRRTVFPEKLLFPVDLSRIASTSPVGFLLVGVLGASAARMETSGSIWKIPQVVLSMVMGLGLCQMAEHMLRVDNVIRIIRIAFSRLREGIWLVTRSERIVFAVSSNAFENTSVLEDFMINSKSSTPRFLSKSRSISSNYELQS